MHGCMHMCHLSYEYGTSTCTMVVEWYQVIVVEYGVDPR